MRFSTVLWCACFIRFCNILLYMLFNFSVYLCSYCIYYHFIDFSFFEHEGFNYLISEPSTHFDENMAKMGDMVRDLSFCPICFDFGVKWMNRSDVKVHGNF